MPSTFSPLGFGLVRPFRRTAQNDFASASGPPLVRACVGQVIGTVVGEVPWRPRFGTLLARLRHMRNTAALPELARLSIGEGLQRWETRAVLSDVGAAPIKMGTENMVLLSVRYRIGDGAPQTFQAAL
jgi:phage baseplate assembly protein W